MFKAFAHHKLKTAMLFVSAVSSITSIFLIVALAEGIIGMYASMLKTDGDIIVLQKGVADTFFSDVNRSLMEPIARIDGVKSVQGVIVGAGEIDDVPIGGIYGFTQNRIRRYRPVQGSYPSQPFDVMLGKNIDTLLEHPDTITLMGETFRVTGVYESSIGFENGGVVIDIADAQKLFHKSASFLLVSLDDFETDASSVVARIEALSGDIEVRTTDAFVDNYNQFKIIRITSGVIAFISFFLGFLAIVSLMSIVINDRKYEFGIKRALGISSFRIIAGVLTEVIVLTGAAFVAAWALSVAILEVLQHIPKFQGYLNGTIDAALFVEVLVGALCMGALGALIPAWAAAKVDPIILINRVR